MGCYRHHPIHTNYPPLMNSNCFGEMKKSMTPTNLATTTLPINFYKESIRDIGIKPPMSKEESPFMMRGNKEGCSTFWKNYVIKKLVEHHIDLDL